MMLLESSNTEKAKEQMKRGMSRRRSSQAAAGTRAATVGVEESRKQPGYSPSW